jgi:hypothetical protein
MYTAWSLRHDRGGLLEMIWIKVGRRLPLLSGTPSFRSHRRRKEIRTSRLGMNFRAVVAYLFALLTGDRNWFQQANRWRFDSDVEIQVCTGALSANSLTWLESAKCLLETGPLRASSRGGTLCSQHFLASATQLRRTSSCWNHSGDNWPHIVPGAAGFPSTTACCLIVSPPLALPGFACAVTDRCLAFDLTKRRKWLA